MVRTTDGSLQQHRVGFIGWTEYSFNLSKDAEDKLVDKLVQLFLPAAEISTMKQKEYLTEKEVSLLYSVSISTLRTERCRGAGPGYVKDGRRVLYPKKTLNEYMHRRFVKTDETLF